MSSPLALPPDGGYPLPRRNSSTSLASRMNSHLLIVHFPVSFIVLGAFVELAGAALRDRALRDWAWRLLLMGSLAAFLAFATGESARMAAMGAGYMGGPELETHELWGSVGIWALAVAALLRTLWRHRMEGPFAWINLLLMMGAAAVVVIITVFGTLVRHG
jgi:uncharacterized membrane protein